MEHTAYSNTANDKMLINIYKEALKMLGMQVAYYLWRLLVAMIF